MRHGHGVPVFFAALASVGLAACGSSSGTKSADSAASEVDAAGAAGTPGVDGASTGVDGGSVADSPAGSDASDVTSAPADVYPNVHVLSDDVASQAVVSGTTIFFPSSVGDAVTQLQVGDVIVSGYGDGFILKVTSSPVESATGPADAAPQPKIQLLRHIYGGPAGETETWFSFQTAAGNFLDVFRDVDATLTFTPPSLTEDASGYIVAGDASAGLIFSKALVSVGSILSFRIRIINGQLDAVATQSTLTLSAAYAIRLFAQGNTAWTGAKTVWTSVPIPIRFQLGIVPVVSSLTFDLVLSASAAAQGLASVEVGKSCSNTLESTVTWTAGNQWTSEKTPTTICSTIGPDLTLQANATVGGMATLESKWNFRSLGIVAGGSELAINAHLDATANICPAPGSLDLSFGTGADLSANFSLFGVSVGASSWTLFEQDDPIASLPGSVSAALCPCAPNGGGELCGNGETCCPASGGTAPSCRPSCDCPGTYQLCNGVCVDQTTDIKNCGGCGRACTDSESCVAGNCVFAGTCEPFTNIGCPSGQKCTGLRQGNVPYLVLGCNNDGLSCFQIEGATDVTCYQLCGAFGRTASTDCPVGETCSLVIGGGPVQVPDGDFIFCYTLPIPPAGQ